MYKIYIFPNKPIYSKIQIEYQPSFLPFTQDTTSGRRSFNSFNKSVEVKKIDDIVLQYL